MRREEQLDHVILQQSRLGNHPHRRLSFLSFFPDGRSSHPTIASPLPRLHFSFPQIPEQQTDSLRTWFLEIPARQFLPRCAGTSACNVRLRSRQCSGHCLPTAPFELRPVGPSDTMRCYSTNPCRIPLHHIFDILCTDLGTESALFETKFNMQWPFKPPKISHHLQGKGKRLSPEQGVSPPSSVAVCQGLTLTAPLDGQTTAIH